MSKMTDTDKELLEMAAKAAGYSLGTEWDCLPDGIFINGDDHFSGIEWNPLTDDGDALRLAVKLGFIVDIDIDEHYTEIEFTSNYEDKSASEGHGFDTMKATRRAITRAAAQIRKEME